MLIFNQWMQLFFSLKIEFSLVVGRMSTYRKFQSISPLKMRENLE